MIRNLNPKPSNEAYLNNDGQQIAFTFRNRAVYSSYIAAIEDQLNNENSAAADKLLKIADTHPKEEKILRQLIPLLINIKSNDLAKKHLIALGTISSFDMVDYSNMGYLHSLAGEHENAMKNYRKALTIEPENSAVLNNLGYELVLTEAYQEADEILQKAIKLDPELPDPYSILGLLNVLTGKLEAGRVLIDKCLGLDPANAYAHKHLGIFYLKMKEKENAFINLKKAAELDSNINVDLYLQEAQLIN
ncbi:hypothetical protein [Mucilaginibacter dorajii]|uniref:Tetratricopeptide repeat protein n=1 Tax=Mucilaginibacter dorajii TaxID=692994 RepID=A0ABP7QVE8_9SPHI|nr:hypothetical protein [Mucilaginibacter dorajii]MCS3735696.1 Flp pilus assembly protein TadD [Mucilaginibacter dorajii]